MIVRLQCAIECDVINGDNLGNAFFLQVPSVDKWSNMSVLFEPIICSNDYVVDDEHGVMYFIRIYTTVDGIGYVQFDGAYISTADYKQIANTDYYYYETETASNDSHLISTLHPPAIYSVSY